MQEVICKLGRTTHVSFVIDAFVIVIISYDRLRDRLDTCKFYTLGAGKKDSFYMLTIGFCSNPSVAPAFPWGPILFKNLLFKIPFLLSHFHSFFNIYKPTRRTHRRTEPRFLERLCK